MPRHSIFYSLNLKGSTGEHEETGRIAGKNCLINAKTRAAGSGFLLVP